ncbi:MAG: isopenicillin synthase family oxygenase [Ilumatobacteraceae bacterium]|nr:isopenicillin synthase family oxygenase [Ilumatobacteraceae bacterium]
MTSGEEDDGDGHDRGEHQQTEQHQTGVTESAAAAVMRAEISGNVGQQDPHGCRVLRLNGPVTSLPMLDLAAFAADPDSPEAREFAEALTAACHEIGFVYLTGHGVDAEVEARVFSAAEKFFALPEADRLAIVNTRSPHFRGYTRLGHEHTNGVSDRRDQIDIGPERDEPVVDEDAPRWMRLRGPNQWPPAVPEMQPAVATWMAQMERAARLVLRALAIGLGQPADRFDGVVAGDPEVLVKIIRYPAASAADPGVEASAAQGVGAHHDSGLLTFIMQDSVGGLQVLRGDSFVDAPWVPGAYILNLGEMLQLATNGYLRATKHRVVSPRNAQRISVAYFFNPAMEATLVPVELPPALAALAPGGQNANPDDPVLSTYGDNWLKFRIRSHPDVAAIHHPDLVISP